MRINSSYDFLSEILCRLCLLLGTIAVILSGLTNDEVWAKDAYDFHLPDTYPYQKTDTTGHHSGLMPDIVSALARRSGVPMNAVFSPARRLAEEIYAGDYDFALGLPGGNYLDNAKVIAQGPCVGSFLFFRKVRINKDEPKIGIVRGILNRYFQDERPDYDVVETKDVKTLMLMVLNKRLDGFAITSGAYGLIRQDRELLATAGIDNLDDFLEPPIVLQMRPLQLVASHKREFENGILSAVSEAYEALLNDGAIDAIYAHHGLNALPCPK